MPLGSKMYRPNDIKMEIVRQLPWVWNDIGISNTEERVLRFSAKIYKIITQII